MECEYIYKIVEDMDGVDCYIKTGQIVRCKDCVHKEREQPGMVFCPMMVGSWIDEDHFCGWGERREDG